MKTLAIVVLALLCPLWCAAQTYNARTDVTATTYSSVPGCLGLSANCTGNSALVGAGSCITPAVWNIPICRITDGDTACGPANTNRLFTTNQGGSAEVNFMNTNDTLFSLATNGGYGCIFYSSTGNPLTATVAYTNSTFATWLWSFNVPTEAYTAGACASPTTDICLYTWSFSTPSSPTSTSIDVSSACSSYVSGLEYLNDFTIAGDDETFGFLLNTGPSGQGSTGAHYAVVYSKTNGCRIFDSQGLTLSGAWGTTGAATSNPDSITLHNMRINKSGTDVKLGPTACVTQGTASVVDGSQTLTWVSGGQFVVSSTWSGSSITINGVTGTYTIQGTPGSSTSLTITPAWTGGSSTYAFIIYAVSNTGTCNDDNIYTWNVSTTNDYLTLNTTNGTFACGHQSIGYTYTINHCVNSTNQDWYYRASHANSLAGTSVPSSFPAAKSSSLDDHSSWDNGNSSDTAPFCTTTTTGAFGETNAWDNEVMCFAMNGTGLVWRFSPTYTSSVTGSTFSSSNAIGSVSQDGKWFFFTSDYDGNFGNTNLSSATCTLGTNCRNDVIAIQLSTNTPIAPAKGPFIAPGAAF